MHHCIYDSVRCRIDRDQTGAEIRLNLKINETGILKIKDVNRLFIIGVI